jgi:MscS family membrane protein
MKEFLDYSILDNSVRNLLLVGGLIVIAFIFKKHISRLIANLFYRMFKNSFQSIDIGEFRKVVEPPNSVLLILIVFLVGFEKLTFPRAWNVTIYKIRLRDLIETVGIIFLIISFIWLCLRIIDFIAQVIVRKASHDHSRGDHQVIVFFKDFFKVLLVIIGMLMVLKYAFGFQISNLITGLSIAGAALALSFRESIENLIASFVIFFEKPFKSGDLVKVQNFTGTVEKVGLRSTRIHTDQKTYASVPNKQMVDTIVDNLTMRTQRRAFLQLEISSATPAESVHQLILAIQSLLQRNNDKIESFSVFLADIVKNAFIVNVEFYTSPIPIGDFNMVKQNINLSIIELMEELNIRLAQREENNHQI